MRDCRKPVIAAVEGAAAGAGLSLALACDMLVAARNAVFSVAYVKVGLTPDGGATAFLAEFVSRQVLTELCLTGERISGERLRTGPCQPPGRTGRGAGAGSWRWHAQVATGLTWPWAASRALCRSAYSSRWTTSWAGSTAHGAVADHRRIPRRHRLRFWKSARPISHACARLLPLPLQP